MMGRVLAFAPDGALLGRFPDTDAGHLWAHCRVRKPVFSGHIEIFDPATRTSLMVDPEECTAVRWRRCQLSTPPCDCDTTMTPEEMSRKAYLFLPAQRFGT